MIPPMAREEARACERCGWCWYAEAKTWTGRPSTLSSIGMDTFVRGSGAAHAISAQQKRAEYERWRNCPNCGSKKVRTVPEGYPFTPSGALSSINNPVAPQPHPYRSPQPPPYQPPEATSVTPQPSAQSGPTVPPTIGSPPDPIAALASRKLRAIVTEAIKDDEPVEAAIGGHLKEELMVALPTRLLVAKWMNRTALPFSCPVWSFEYNELSRLTSFVNGKKTYAIAETVNSTFDFRAGRAAVPITKESDPKGLRNAIRVADIHLHTADVNRINELIELARDGRPDPASGHPLPSDDPPRAAEEHAPIWDDRRQAWVRWDLATQEWYGFDKETERWLPL